MSTDSGISRFLQMKKWILDIVDKDELQMGQWSQNNCYNYKLLEEKYG